MADTKISALPAAVTATSTMEFPVNNGGVTNKVTLSTMAVAVNAALNAVNCVNGVATTAALPTNTYNNGSAGVGATLTATASGALTVDSVAVTVGMNILVKNEVTQANNGVYTVTQSGDSTHPYVLTRSAFMNQPASFTGATIVVGPTGGVNANTIWVCATLSVVIGTTAINFNLAVGGGAAVDNTTVAFVNNRIAVKAAPTFTSTTLPASPAGGMFAFESDTTRFAFYNGASWQNHVRLNGDTMTGALAISATGTALAVTGAATFGGGNTNGLSLSGGSGNTTIQATGIGPSAINLIASSTGSIFAQNANGVLARFDDGGGTVANQLQFKPATTGNSPTLSASGTDTNISLVFFAKGTGVVRTSAGGSFQAGHLSTDGSTINPGGASSNAATLQGLYVAGNYTGSWTGANDYALNSITATTNTVANTGNGLTDLLVLNHNFGGSGFSGSAQGLEVNMTQTGVLTGGSHIAIQTTNYFSQNAGGTSLSAAGSAWGMNINTGLQSGATYYAYNYGLEIDTRIQSGASVANNIGLGIVAATNHAVQGTLIDAAVAFGKSITATVGWKNILLLGGHSGDIPLDPVYGSIIAYQLGTDAISSLRQTLPPSTLNGIHLNNITFSGYAFDAPGFGVLASGTQSGVVVGNALLSSTTSGLSVDLPYQRVTVNPTVASGGTTGKAFVGDYLFDTMGGIYEVATVSGNHVATVTLLQTPISSAPPYNPVAVSGASIGGVSLNLTWTTGANTLALSPSGGGTTVGGALNITGMMTIGSSGITASSGSVLNITSGGASNAIFFKNGPGGGGNVLLQMGGSNADIEPNTNITLPGGTWGSNSLVNNTAPITQNATFTGSTTNSQAAFGAFLQQTDNSSNTVNGTGFTENLILNGSNVLGWRGAGAFYLLLNASTGNTTSMGYTALSATGRMSATDANVAGGSSMFGGNMVSGIGPGVTAATCCGLEIDTYICTGASVVARIGTQIVDCVNGGGYGVQGTQDDVALSLNNQYGPSSTLGWKIGLEFGRYGGNFPVSTVGTLIGAQGSHGASWTVANGIDFSLGIATSYWLKLGTVFTVSGAGAVVALSLQAASAVVTGSVTLSGLPTSNSGLVAGSGVLWNNGGILCVA